MIFTRKANLLIFCIWLVTKHTSAAPSVSEKELTEESSDEQILQSDIPKLPGEDEVVVNHDLQYGKMLFQGDLKLDETQKEVLLKNDTGSTSILKSRTGVLDAEYRWPKNSQGHVVIPYIVDILSGYSLIEVEIMRQAMNDLEKYTCVRFVRRTVQPDYIHIFNGDGCYSRLGRHEGGQELSLERFGCVDRGTVIHELVHAIGYDHMHNHADRDNFIDINWENIDPELWTNFKKLNPLESSNFGTSYDYMSIMHYDRKAFSKNGRDTMVPKDRNYLGRIGHRKGMTRGDAKRINNMYNCKP